MLSLQQEDILVRKVSLQGGARELSPLRFLLGEKKKTKEWNSIPSFQESGMQILRLKVSEVNTKSHHTKHQASIIC